MFKYLYPDEYYKQVHDIPLIKLKQKGIKGLVFDVDNTLSPYDEAEPGEAVIQLIKNALNNGFAVCLLSNNSVKRIKLYNEKLKINSIARAFKPSKKGLLKAMRLMGIQNDETAIIGDQVFTDVWCGKRCGVYTILVAPLSDKDELSVKLKRGAEKAILKKYFNNLSNNKDEGNF